MVQLLDLRAHDATRSTKVPMQHWPKSIQGTSNVDRSEPGLRSPTTGKEVVPAREIGRHPAVEFGIGVVRTQQGNQMRTWWCHGRQGRLG
ncbi:MAG: hypothetical protein M1823_000723 [Watsoniomyces obsoletus]|nr:MAG: hypothetical protein M1823_000723 [Watsoniomyces obsoletus]